MEKRETIQTHKKNRHKEKMREMSEKHRIIK
jgi:hypothetical protein